MSFKSLGKQKDPSILCYEISFVKDVSVQRTSDVERDPSKLTDAVVSRSYNVLIIKCNNIEYDEKSKTTERLTQRDIFKTIFRLARPAFFRFRCY